MNGRRAGYVVDGRFLAGRATGLQRVARSLLAAALEQGLEAAVWAPAGTDDPLVTAHVALPAGRATGRVWEQLLLPARSRGRTIVSLTNTSPLVAPGVVMVHDLAPLVGPQWFAGSMRAYSATVCAGARRARLVVTTSRAVHDELVAIGVQARRLVVVPPAVDPRFVADETAAARVRAAQGLTRPYVLMVGWADPRKDLATALAAHRAVRQDLPHELVLVGAGHPTFAPVTPPRDPSVRRVGHVDDRDLVGLLAGADVLLYPSRYEGFGLPPLEAMACGTPAVVSDIPSLRESTAGRARLASVGDTAAWADALAEGLSGRLPCPPDSSRPPRSWADAAAELISALHDLPLRRSA